MKKYLRKIYIRWSLTRKESKDIKQLIRDQRSEDEAVLFALLRKDCHILDKGLNMVPFEKGHAHNVYKESLLFESKIKSEQIKKDPAYAWCRSIIRLYEEAQINGHTSSNDPVIMYGEKEKNLFYSFLTSRVSSRNFTDKVINDATWNELINLANDAPTGCCRQTTRYYVLKDSKSIESVVKHVAGATGFNKIPYLICVTSDRRPYTPLDRKLAYIDASLSVENFVLAARANNIFTTILNWQHATDAQNQAVKEIVEIPAYEQIIIFIAAGFSDNVPSKPVRMSTASIIKYK